MNKRLIWSALAVIAMIGIYIGFRPTYGSHAIESKFSFDYLNAHNVKAWCFTDYDICKFVGQYSGSKSNFLIMAGELGLTEVDKSSVRYESTLANTYRNEGFDISYDRTDDIALYHRDLPGKGAYITSTYVTGSIIVCARGTKKELKNPRVGVGQEMQ